MKGISIREFARRDGCSEGLVRRAVAQGRLKKLSNGRMDPAAVGTMWRTGNADGSATRSTEPESKPKSFGGASGQPDTASEVGSFASKTEAERVDKAYAGLLKRLDYDKKSGVVVDVADVQAVVAEEYARVRSLLLGIPAAIAPRCAALKSSEQVRALIEEEINQALTELAYDGAGADRDTGTGGLSGGDGSASSRASADPAGSAGAASASDAVGVG